VIKESLKRGINYMETGPWYGQGTSEITFGKVSDIVINNLDGLS
jgi:aryl-alcohol dehydrogenase-like predicted oxidoreductase